MLNGRSFHWLAPARVLGAILLPHRQEPPANTLRVRSLFDVYSGISFATWLVTMNQQLRVK